MIERLEQTMRKSNARLGPDGHLVSDTSDSRRLTEKYRLSVTLMTQVIAGN